MENLIDYEILKLIWWLLIGVLLVGFAVMDGHDMGVGTLLPFVGKTDDERRAVINTVAPHWDGNQVWFITAGGAIFAAWPMIYATAFSGFYWAMMAVLWSMFFRPVGFDYRSKLTHTTWRKTWDWGLFVGSFIPPVIFGVAFGNLLQGVPFQYDSILNPTYTGGFWALLNPFALLCGVVASGMITFHGSVYLMHRTEDPIYTRAQSWMIISGLVTVICFTLAGLWVAFGIDGYRITSAINLAASPDPLTKEVVRETGAWLANYQRWPLTILIPVLGYVGILGALLLAKKGKTFAAFFISALGITGIIGTAGISMFPFMMPSSSHLSSSLTVWDSSSSHFTLFVMLIAVVIFMPIIILYTRWAYSIMRGKVTTAYIRENEHSVY
ncbi:cytochrome bd oxidase subunit II [Advenella faeciporci]|uniref:Cytochrome bd oxidase subunit II n=1 Tax=Advenella faeciporci TaxID=797535 RepID=A0A918MZM9_9BURK|nr:cytochrome bd oxidase subunit II [Advenella faeciporci]